MITAQPYTPQLFDRWNAFVAASANGTLFHRLDFLRYHGSRFAANESHLVFMKGEAIVGLLPLAVFDDDTGRVARSPYGGSFGGIVLRDGLGVTDILGIADALGAWLRAANVARCLLSPTPVHYQRVVDETLDFALGAQGFRLVERDLFSVTALPGDYEALWARYEGRCRTTLRRRRDQFDIQSGAPVTDFYPILLQDKARHHGARPTHAEQELRHLAETFPQQVWCDVATHRETGARAGICYMAPTATTWLTFYMAQEDRALGLDGVNVLVDHGMQHAIRRGCAYFDFGGSSVGFQIPNPGVAHFKESFGTTGFLRDRLEWTNDGR